MSHKKSLEEKLEKTENVLRENLNTVRAGRANPALLDRVNVDYYGVPTPLKSLANDFTVRPIHTGNHRTCNQRSEPGYQPIQ